MVCFICLKLTLVNFKDSLDNPMTCCNIFSEMFSYLKRETEWLWMAKKLPHWCACGKMADSVRSHSSSSLAELCHFAEGQGTKGAIDLEKNSTPTYHPHLSPRSLPSIEEKESSLIFWHLQPQVGIWISHSFFSLLPTAFKRFQILPYVPNQPTSISHQALPLTDWVQKWEWLPTSCQLPRFICLKITLVNFKDY